MILTDVLLGFALSCATGFRIFIPLLALSIASLGGFIHLSHDLLWIGTVPSLIVFAVATLFEIIAYFIPFVDNFMDTADMPLAVIAGVIATSSVINGMSPLLHWTVAIVVGGVVPGVIKMFKSTLRLALSAITGGLGNHVMAFLELVASSFITITSIMLALSY